ncbi:hypothetical protein [Helicobacter sp. 23-1045]
MTNLTQNLRDFRYFFIRFCDSQNLNLDCFGLFYKSPRNDEKITICVRFADSPRNDGVFCFFKIQANLSAEVS